MYQMDGWIHAQTGKWSDVNGLDITIYVVYLLMHVKVVFAEP